MMKFLITLNVTTMEQIVALTEILTTCHLLTSGESTTLELKNTCHTQPYFERTISLTVLLFYFFVRLADQSQCDGGQYSTQKWYVCDC